jgi:hypothetical protein
MEESNTDETKYKNSIGHGKKWFKNGLRPN